MSNIHGLSLKNSLSDPAESGVILRTSYKGLRRFCRHGFLAGDTLISQAIFELGQSRKHHFTEQNFDLNGQATLRPRELFLDQDAIVEATQEILEALGYLEKLLHTNNFQAFRSEKEHYFSTIERLSRSENIHVSALARSIQYMHEAEEPFASINTVQSLGCKGPNSLAEQLRRESTQVLSALRSYNFLYTRKKGHLVSGPTGTAAKRALQKVQVYSFPLSITPQLQNDLLSPKDKDSSSMIEVALKKYTHGFGPEEAKLMQRFSTALNKNDVNRLPSLRPLSHFRTGLHLPVLWFYALLGTDNPWNLLSGAKNLFLSIILKPMAFILDNIGGFFAGLVQKNFSFFRKVVAKFEFSHEPDSDDARKEFLLCREVAPLPTLGNKLSRLVSAVLIHTGSTIAYKLHALWSAASTLLVDSVFFRRRTRGLDLREEVMNILRYQLDEHPIRSFRSNVIKLQNPLDPYRQNDFIEMLGQSLKIGFSGLAELVDENPTVGFLLILGLAIIASPTIVQGGAEYILRQLHLSKIIERFTGFIQNEISREKINMFLMASITNKLNLLEAANIVNLDVSRVLTALSDRELPVFEHMRSDSSDSNLSEKEGALISSVFNDPLKSALLVHGPHLAFLSQVQKNRLCRYILKLYPHDKALFEWVMRQCDQPYLIKVPGSSYVISQSPLAKSLVHLVSYVGWVVNLVFMIPRMLRDLCRWKQSSMVKKHLFTLKILLKESCARLGSFFGGVLFGLSRTVLAIAKMPFGVMDQCIKALNFGYRFLKNRSFSFCQKPSPETAVDSRSVFRRAVVAARLQNVVTKASSGLSQCSKLHDLQAFRQIARTPFWDHLAIQSLGSESSFQKHVNEAKHDNDLRRPFLSQNSELEMVGRGVC